MNAFAAERAGMKPGSIKVNNMQLVYQLLLEEEPMSIRELCETLSLSRVSVSKIIGAFMEKGIAYVAGKGRSTVEGGKYPDLYKLNLDYKKVISLFLSAEYFGLTVTNLGYEVLYQERVAFPFEISYPEFISLVCATVRRVMEEQKLAPADLMGVVLGLDGVVDMEQGILRFQVHHHWPGQNIPICADVAAGLPEGVKVYAGSVSRFVGLSARRALGPDCGSFLMLIAGRNTGSCFISADLVSRNYGDTELGTLMMDANQGVELHNSFAAKTSIVRLRTRLAELRGENPEEVIRGLDQFSAFRLENSGIEDIFRDADEGDPTARQALDEVIRYFGVLLNNLSVIYTPKFIIIGGDYGSAGSYFKERLDEQVRKGHMAMHGFPVELKYGMDYTDFAAGASYYTALMYLKEGKFE